VLNALSSLLLYLHVSCLSVHPPLPVDVWYLCAPVLSLIQRMTRSRCVVGATAVFLPDSSDSEDEVWL
jgi:hypothetical protein